MKKIKNFLNQRGISILEVVVSIVIIAIGMIGVLSLVIQNVQGQYINRNILIASGLAQEGLELVRNVRDLNWLNQENGWDWNENIIGDGTYTIDYIRQKQPNQLQPTINDTPDTIANARLYINANNLYTHISSGNTPTNFYRLITVVNNTDYLDVKCTIRWAQGSQYRDYVAETYLYDWR
jgi:type II secretory pathway pseudopilin PulG